MMPSKTSSVTKLLVNADVLFDTRMGTIARMSPQLAIEMMWIGDRYRSRLSDEFHFLNPKINLVEYRKRYAARDIETLKNSTISTFVAELAKVIEGLEERAALGDPRCKYISVHVNFYPYQLSSEQKQMFLSCLSTYVGFTTTLVAVDIPFSHLTTNRMRIENYSHVYLYDLEEWMQAAYGKPDSMIANAPELTITACALAKDSRALLDEIKNPIPDVPQNPFDLVKYSLASFFNQEWLTPEAFSIVDPRELLAVKKTIEDRIVKRHQQREKDNGDSEDVV
jgi:hypothetical protein